MQNNPPAREFFYKPITLLSYLPPREEAKHPNLLIQESNYKHKVRLEA
ncbi:hypothetical protein BACCOP_02115 [Phocaeicola coprocola DSM 17136]|uniref:Uncharacterized protein n=1 Tax=Phocaeicola coprocola DSM 17136 TaxID=470145 RepID=B3JJP4_9BACT|nr:hypothetical protein BACCOP_02115 [Phocaeicola coprocola DSM 17136]